MKRVFSRRTVLAITVILLLVIAVASLFFHYMGTDISPYIEYVGVGLALIGILLSEDRVFRFLFRSSTKTKAKEPCRHLKKEDCPYSDISECPYNTDYCCAHKKENPRKLWKASIMLLLLFGCSVILVTNSVCPFVEKSSFLKLVYSLSLAYVAAYVTAKLIDIPTRLQEHQEHFVGLLTSNEYLKTLSENDLSSLREQITRLQRMKDVPNMPEGLMKRDNSISDLLNDPFFRQYSQIVELEEYVPQDGELFAQKMVRKKVHVDGSGFNPYPKDKEIVIDLGLSLSLCFDDKQYDKDEDFIKQAKKLFVVKSFKIYVDGAKKPFDIVGVTEVRLKKKKKDGFNYNAYVSLVNRTSETHGIHIDPDSTEIVKQLNYTVDSSTEPDKLYVCFHDKIRFSIDYEIIVPLSDTCFTKRLRYPVKYLHIDYSLGKGLEDYRLVGQLIGTMIDQTDITTFTSENDSKIILDTHSWLLPKNGAVIVHQKRDSK